MNDKLTKIKNDIMNLDDYEKLYLLGFIQGITHDYKGIGDEE